MDANQAEKRVKSLKVTVTRANPKVQTNFIRGKPVYVDLIRT